MKKIFLSVFILIGAVALMACGNKADKMMEELTSVNNVYAISAVSGVEETINQVNEEVIVEDETNNEPQEEVSESNNLDSLLGLLNEDLFNVVELNSDNEEYTNLLEINLNKETYLFYFNETLLDREEDDDEEEKIMNGILIYNDNTYNFKSEEEIESDESEIKVIIYKNIYANRIEIEKEFEVNEYQYEYTIYEANKEVITIELEVEDDEMEFQIETDEDEHEYIIEKINNNQFKIIYDEEIIFYLTIDINNKTYTYNYNDQNIVK